MHDTTHVTILLALLCTACVAGPADGESGTATEGGETGDTGDEPEPIACRAPCAIVSVTATQYLFYAELWAVELGVEGEPNGTPQPLFDGSVFASNLIGPTPWGHVAAYAWNETGQLSIADDTLVFDPLLPDAFAAMTTDLAFSDDARFAFAHVTEELFSGQRLWGVAFEGDVAVDMWRLDALPALAEGFIIGEQFVGNAGVAFRSLVDGRARLYHAAFDPPEQPKPLTSVDENALAFAASDAHLVALVDDAQDLRSLRVWPLPDPSGTPQVLAEDVQVATVELGGTRVSYTDAQGTTVVVDVESGDAVELALEQVWGRRWLRDGVLLASLGDTREWVMVAFDGMLAQAPSAVTGTLPPDTAIDRLVCDPSGQRCLFSQVSTLTPDPESASHHLVDVSGTSAGEPIWLLDAAPAEIVWFGEAHAIIHANDAAEVHVVDASAGAAQVHTIAPGVTVNEVIGLDPEHDRVLFVADAGAGTQLWRASIDGSSLAPIVPTHRWLDADGWYVHEVAVID